MRLCCEQVSTHTQVHHSTHLRLIATTEQHKIRAEVSTAVVQSISREIHGISESKAANTELDYKHLCSEAINEMRDKNSYNYLICIDGSELGDLVLNNTLNLRKKNDFVTVFHATKDDDKVENFDFKSTVVKSKVETHLIATLLPKYYTLCWRARHVYDDGSMQSVRDAVIQLLTEYRIYKYTHSLAYSDNTNEVFTLPTTKQPDFLVLGHLGRKGLSKHNNELTTLGSTADITLKSAHIPCILMKKAVTTTNKFYSIAVDNSELSKAGLDILLALVRPRDKLRVVHVFDTNSLTDENLNILKDYYNNELNNFGPSDAEVVVISKINDSEDMTDLICNWVEENSPDYFAITPKAREGNDLSSLTASIITRSPCNIILCKQ